jgi:hypothetical protein
MYNCNINKLNYNYPGASNCASLLPIYPSESP